MAKPSGKAKPKKPTKAKKPLSPWRKWMRGISLLSLIFALLLSACGDWYVHHAPTWLEDSSRTLPDFLHQTLMYAGNRAGAVTDAFGFTGHDAVYDSDDPVPEGQVLFAGLPKRIGAPAPNDITILDRGNFIIGWSPSLGHPAYVAYHVPAEARFENTDARPGFKKDPAVPTSPAGNAYARTGYDRGHMVPNYAILTRFGPEAQANTFLMTNIAPQRPAFNRGVWRRLEHFIAELWTHRYGEIWVMVGAIPQAGHTKETLSGTRIHVPEAYWMLITAQDADGVRALAVVLPQTADYDEFAVHHIVTIDELEEMTGLDLLPDLPGFLEEPLEADRPTRLWPIRWIDAFDLLRITLS